MATFVENYYRLFFRQKYLININDYIAIGNYLAKSKKRVFILEFRPEKI